MLDNFTGEQQKNLVVITEYQSVMESDRWFGGLPPLLRAAILQRMRVRTLADEEEIYRIGDPSNGLHCVLEGEVRLIAYPDTGRPFITRIFRQGKWFGSMSVCDEGPQQHDAVAFETAVVATLGRSDIASVADEIPAIWRHIAKLNGSEHRFASEFVMAMLGQSPVGRLKVLLRLGSMPGPDGVPAIKITQEELAAVAGLSRQHINSLLHELESNGRIERGYKTIRIINPDLIQR